MTTKERPILFSAPMVRAILNGSKTQTRRVMKPQPTPWCQGMQTPIYTATPLSAFIEGAPIFLPNPYGKAGDQVWVRESWEVLVVEQHNVALGYAATPERERSIDREALTLEQDEQAARFEKKSGFVPSIHMPRWASRIQLEITGVRVERLNDISVNDSIAEGCNSSFEKGDTRGAKACFQDLWESINGAGSWSQNPWVWVIEFERIKQ